MIRKRSCGECVSGAVLKSTFRLGCLGSLSGRRKGQLEETPHTSPGRAVQDRTKKSYFCHVQSPFWNVLSHYPAHLVHQSHSYLSLHLGPWVWLEKTHKDELISPIANYFQGCLETLRLIQSTYSTHFHWMYEFCSILCLDHTFSKTTIISFHKLKLNSFHQRFWSPKFSFNSTFFYYVSYLSYTH